MFIAADDTTFQNCGHMCVMTAARARMYLQPFGLRIRPIVKVNIHAST